MSYYHRVTGINITERTAVKKTMKRQYMTSCNTDLRTQTKVPLLLFTWIFLILFLLQNKQTKRIKPFYRYKDKATTDQMYEKQNKSQS